MRRRTRENLDSLDDDVRDHIFRETEENIARGMAPDEAAAAARRAFGNVLMTKETARAVWIPVWWDHVLQDARYALRLCRRSPGFTVVVVLTLALGIGLNTAVFSVLNAVLWRPLAYPHPERLVWVAPYDDGSGQDDVVISPDFVAWRDQATVFERLTGFFTGAEPIDVGDEVVQARIASVTDGFWDITGASFALGGPPPSGEDGIVLSHAFFERWFHADRSIIGRPVMLNARRNVIAGVLPAGFHPQLVSPPAFVAAIAAGEIEVYRANVIRPVTGPGVQPLNVVGLLRDGVSIERARAELESIREARRRADPRRAGASRLRVVPYADKLVGDARKPLLILQTAVGLVLLIVCVNTANLLLVRRSARQREIAIRRAVGAGRARLLRQFFVESLLLGAIGAAAGLLAARGVIAVVLRLLPLAVPRMSETTIDARVLVFALGACVATTLVFACVPAIAIWKTGVYDTLKDGARPAPVGLRSGHMRGALVAIEVALTVLLLVAAGLMVRSFWRMTAYPPGFAPDRVLTMRVQFSGPRYRDLQNRRAFIDEVVARARTAPGVEAAGVGSNGDAIMLVTVAGAPDMPPEQKPRATLSSVSEGYAAAIGLRVVKGRWLTDREPLPVFVINETLARQTFPGIDPIGQRIRLPFPTAKGFAPVVGVVADLRYSKLGAATEPELFIDYAHSMISDTVLAVRTSGDPISVAPPLRALLSSIDRTQTLFDVKPLDVVLAESIAPRRLNLVLLGTFAASALLLVIVGIYGVVAYTVAQRTHEIGVRIALGAARRQVVVMIVRQGMALALAGIGLGLAGAVASTRVMSALLYEVTPTDPATFAAAAGTIIVTAFAACAWPAVKASVVDPLIALRCE